MSPASVNLNGSPSTEPHIETLKYALEMKGFDFGILNARNQFISKVINPLMDEVMPSLRHDHIIDSETTYRIALVITSERDVAVQ